MKPTLHISLVSLFLLSACAPASNTQKAPVDKNALIIQADFAGMVMTGVAYSVSKDLDIFNIRPLIPLYDIRAASQSLEYNAQTWPDGTVFVSVVDPGVGTARKSVVLKTKKGHYFVSPDNGSLAGPAETYGIEALREIDETVNRREDTDWAHTFHGRDVYSYTGARLAAGVISFEEVGPLLDPEVILLDKPEARLEDEVLYGQITGGTGRLGNVEFSIDRHLFSQINPELGEEFQISIFNKEELVWSGKLPYVKSFGEVEVGASLFFVNSSGVMSVAINQGQFAKENGISEGVDWRVEIKR